MYLMFHPARTDAHGSYMYQQHPQTTGYKYGWLADTFIPATEHTHKVKATKYVNRRIQEHLEALSLGYNLKRVDPSLPNVQFSLGGTNYKDAGQYFQRVCPLKSRLVLYLHSLLLESTGPEVHDMALRTHIWRSHYGQWRAWVFAPYEGRAQTNQSNDRVSICSWVRLNLVVKTLHVTLPYLLSCTTQSQPSFPSSYSPKQFPAPFRTAHCFARCNPFPSTI